MIDNNADLLYVVEAEEVSSDSEKQSNILENKNYAAKLEQLYENLETEGQDAVSSEDDNVLDLESSDVKLVFAALSDSKNFVRQTESVKERFSSTRHANQTYILSLESYADIIKSNIKFLEKEFVRIILAFHSIFVQLHSIDIDFFPDSEIEAGDSSEEHVNTLLLEKLIIVALLVTTIQTIDSSHIQKSILSLFDIEEFKSFSNPSVATWVAELPKIKNAHRKQIVAFAGNSILALLQEKISSTSPLLMPEFEKLLAKCRSMIINKRAENSLRKKLAHKSRNN